MDRGKIARYGMNVRDVFTIIEIAIGGKAATQAYEAPERIALAIAR